MNQISFKKHSLLWTIVYIIIVALYSLSLILVVCGIGLLIFVLVFGDIVIKNGQILAFGILLYIPIRYFKKRLEREIATSQISSAKNSSKKIDV